MKLPGRIPAIAAAWAVLLAACGSSGGTTTPVTSPASGPSGALGIVTEGAARAAVGGLCDIRARYTGDREAANGVFYDASHEELHVIAAAAEVKDRAAAARLLQAKERVEADLLADPLPEPFPADLDRLIDATRAALKLLGIDVPPCAA